MADTPPLVTIDLDAAPLDGACEFYQRLLGFRVVKTEHAGAFTESRVLASDQVPGVLLRFRCCSPRPPMGAAIGTIRLLTFYVPDPAGVAARIEDPTWVLPPPDHGPADRLILQDSSGYHVALVRPAAGCACGGASPGGTGSR